MAKLLYFAINALLWLLALAEVQRTPEDASALPAAELLGNGFSATSPLIARGLLDTRQIYKCINDGYYPCDHHRGCCKAGWGCCPTECCPGGTNCCNGGGCVYPGGQCCGGGYSCAAGSTCYRVAGSWRCQKSCPGVTTDTTTISRRESTTTTTRTVQLGEARSGFSCPTMTATNSLGDSLELGPNCALKYSPHKPTTTSEAARALRIRHDDCPPTRTTLTVYTTEGTSGLATVTTTVTGEIPALRGFSCAPMTVTNAAGTQLALDDKCAIQVTTPTPIETIKPGIAGKVDVLVTKRFVMLASVFTLLVCL